MSLHVTGLVPSTWNCTPMIIPAGVAAVPWFTTVATNFTGVPAATAGWATSVTTRSESIAGVGAVADTVNVEVSMLLASFSSAMRLTSST